MKKKIMLFVLISFCLSFLAARLSLADTVGTSNNDSAQIDTGFPSQWDGSTVVHTRFGDVQGYPDKDQTLVWKAIPFAAPPVGDLRWRAPQDPKPWKGIRKPRSFNKGCIQPSLFGKTSGSEDCLYLNIWRPRETSAEMLPVYVWIHGGGNSIGSATIVPDYYGNRIASHSKLVFVSINYRLGPMGWFTHPALREGQSPEDASGNFGTLDMIQALKWVHENITAFGGDPSRVMIAGESAGGFNVLSLLTSPRATGLFSRAMCESGMPVTSDVAEGDQQANQVLAQLLVFDKKARDLTAAEALARSMKPEEIRAYLYGKSAREILRCYKPGIGGMINNPAIFKDGYVIPREGFDCFKDGTCPNKVPLIIGSNREEYKLFLYFSRDVSWRSDLYASLAKYISQTWKAYGVDNIARELAASPGQPPVYVYEFTWGAPDGSGYSQLPGSWGKRLGSFHSLEIPFFLGTDTVDGFFNLFLFNKRNKPGRQALSQEMMKYTARFAYLGNPNPPGDSSGIVWEPWSNSPGAFKQIIFNTKGQSPDLQLSRDELTVDSIINSLESDLPEPLKSQTLTYLKNIGIFHDLF